jgi:hypothetical protein
MKKTSPTTFYGALAGLSYAFAQVPGLPLWLALSFKAGAATSMFMLGLRSLDCPPNCPGTNGDGNPKPGMKWPRIAIAGLGGLALVITLTGGCVSANPKAGLATPTEPAFVVNPALNTWSNNAAQLAGTAGTVTGTGTLPAQVVAGVFALLAALSGLWARHKSQVADTLAAGIAQAGTAAVQSVMAHASDTTKYAAVAEAINANLATGQSPGQTEPAK